MEIHSEFLVDIDLDPAGSLDLVRANPFGVYRLPSDGSLLEPYGPRAPLTRGIRGVSQFARANGHVIIAGPRGLELDGVVIVTQHHERAEAAVGALDRSSPWLRNVVYAMKSLVRDICASPWSDSQWLLGDDDGIHAIEDNLVRCLWRGDDLAPPRA